VRYQPPRLCHHRFHPRGGARRLGVHGDGARPLAGNERRPGCQCPARRPQDGARIAAFAPAAGRGLAALLLLLGLTGAGPVCDATWHDASRRRAIPVRIRLPARRDAPLVPVILWSPGVGGDIGAGAVWTQAWVENGIAVVHLEHPGSDGAVYRGDVSPAQRRAMVAAATTPAQLAVRVGDAGFVLDELGRRPPVDGCDLGRIDSSRAAIAGHSMGAWVAQAIAGQRFAGKPTLADPRFRAALAFSPTAATFAGVTMPFMAITGTADGAPSAATAEQRAAALAQRTALFAGMPADGGKYLLVIDGADHMIFAGNRRDDRVAAHAHRVASALTTSFWGSVLLGDAEDAASLAPKVVARQLAPGDRYQRK
jgi:predicted dienelactone hydrolase